MSMKLRRRLIRILLILLLLPPFLAGVSGWLVTSSPRIFALGESMGTGIALQSAAVDPRIEGVVAEASPEKAVATCAFPVLLICDEKDEALPCRHTQRIYAAARGPKQLWEVRGAFHTAALGFQPAEFQRRVLEFFANVAHTKPVQ